MLALKITKASGEDFVLEITPAVEYAFETHYKMGFHKYFRDEERQTGLYWLSWELLRRAGETVKPFGEQFLIDLAKVEIVDADTPNG
jgi:hypothetical protein